RPPGEAPLDENGAPFGLREPLPELFGEYLLVRRMPKGDVDRDVFIAKTTTLGGAERYCEVTVLAPREPAEVAGLVARAQAAMQLSHRSVIPLLDAGAVDGRVYIATDLIRGIDLARLRAALRTQPSAHQVAL